MGGYDKAVGVNMGYCWGRGTVKARNCRVRLHQCELCQSRQDGVSGGEAKGHTRRQCVGRKGKGTRVWDLVESSPVFSCEEEIGYIFPSIRNTHGDDILTGCPAQELISSPPPKEVL